MRDRTSPGARSGRAAGPHTPPIGVLDGSHVVSAYARWAPIYDNVFGLYTRGPCRTAVTKINLLPPGRILEVGVGTGISLPFYDPKHRVVGVDLSGDMLRKARRRVERDHLRHVEALEEMDAENLTFPAASFDAAAAMFFITCVPDPQRALSEMARVVKPGGRVFILSHFSVETGPRAWAERLLAGYSGKMGFRPNFRVAEVLGRPDLKLLERRTLKTFDVFTFLEFERV